MVPAVMIRDGKVIGGVYPDNSSSLGYVETVGSACQNPDGYTAGSYFVDGDSGLYFEATTAIANGATITVGTNCRQTNVASELKKINSDLSELMNPEYIEATIVSGDTWGSMLQRLQNLIDYSKLTPQSYILILDALVFPINDFGNNYAVFTRTGASDKGASVYVISLFSITDRYYYEAIGASRTDGTSSAVPSVYAGKTIKLYY